MFAAKSGRRNTTPQQGRKKRDGGEQPGRRSPGNREEVEEEEEGGGSAVFGKADKLTGRRLLPKASRCSPAAAQSQFQRGGVKRGEEWKQEGEQRRRSSHGESALTVYPGWWWAGRWVGLLLLLLFLSPSHTFSCCSFSFGLVYHLFPDFLFLLPASKSNSRTI